MTGNAPTDADVVETAEPLTWLLNTYMRRPTPAVAVPGESPFRNIATDIQAYDTSYRIKTAQNDGSSAWVPEGGTVTVGDAMDDFGEIILGRHKLVTSVMLENSFV